MFYCCVKLLFISHFTIYFCRYRDSSRSVSYGSNNVSLKQKIAQGFLLNEVVAAIKGDLILLLFYRWESLQYEACFVLVNLQTSKIQNWFESPINNMSVIESNISPDGSRVAVLFYRRASATSRFQYDLYVFSAESGQVQDVILCNTEVRPYVTFDPRFRWSRLAIVNYNNGRNIKDGLVLYSLEEKEVFAVSDVVLSIIYAGGYFCARYSRDGNYLILQKITENMLGAYCYADSYVFNSNTLKLLKHYDSSLQPLSTRCQTNYIPLFSKCGSRICMQSQDTNGEACICIYQLPRPISLQEQCRISILQNIQSCTAIHRLPLPSRLRNFLLFVPEQ